MCFGRADFVDFFRQISVSQETASPSIISCCTICMQYFIEGRKKIITERKGKV
jgi:hypothetical protein